MQFDIDDADDSIETAEPVAPGTSTFGCVVCFV